MVFAIVFTFACGAPQPDSVDSEQQGLTNATTLTTVSARRVPKKVKCAPVADFRATKTQLSTADVDNVLTAQTSSDLVATADVVSTLPLCPSDFSCQKYGSICCVQASTCQAMCIDCAPPQGECFGENPSTGNCGTSDDCGLGFCDTSACVPSSCSCSVDDQWVCTDDCRGRCVGKPSIKVQLEDSVSTAR